LGWGPQIKGAEGKYLVQRIVFRYSSQEFERYSHVHSPIQYSECGRGCKLGLLSSYSFLAFACGETVVPIEALGGSPSFLITARAASLHDL
jgi:hypothetical protein